MNLYISVESSMSVSQNKDLTQGYLLGILLNYDFILVHFLK